MKAYTIATGAYVELASVTAACFEWSTGITPTIITEAANAYAAKLQLPDGEQYLYFDADILFRKKWSVPEVPDDVFAAAPLQFRDRGLREIAKAHPLPNPMLSTGLFVASSAHRAAMARALGLMTTSELPSSAHEETWLNVAIKELGSQVLVLPQTVNSQKHVTVYAVGMHFCMEAGPERKLAAVRYHLAHHAPSELREFLRERGLGDFEIPGPRFVFEPPVSRDEMIQRRDARLSRRALSADGGAVDSAPVGEANLAPGGNDGLAEVVPAHRAIPPVSVAEPVGVPELVGEGVDQQDAVTAAAVAVDDGVTLGVQHDVAPQSRGANRTLGRRKKS